MVLLRRVALLLALSFSSFCLLPSDYHRAYDCAGFAFRSRGLHLSESLILSLSAPSIAAIGQYSYWGFFPEEITLAHVHTIVRATADHRRVRLNDLDRLMRQAASGLSCLYILNDSCFLSLCLAHALVYCLPTVWRTWNWTGLLFPWSKPYPSDNCRYISGQGESFKSFNSHSFNASTPVASMPAVISEHWRSWREAMGRLSPSISQFIPFLRRPAH